jgi:glycosyltransferase involved in cell wall biosynthesis
MISVCVDTGNASLKTGIGIYGYGLLKALNQYVPSEVDAFEARVSCPGDQLRPIRRLVYLARLQMLRQNKFHGARVVHFVNQYVPMPCKNVSFIMTVHDLDPILAPQSYTRRYVFYFQKVLQNSLDRVRMIEVHSNAVRSDVISRYGIPENRFYVIGDGLSDEFIAMAKILPSTVPQIPTLLFVGQINMKKNVAWLTKTMVQGVKNGALPPMKLVIAGGPGYGITEFKKEMYGAQNIVEWIQSPSLQEIVKLYRQCSAVVLPSLREGFGRTILEAMYCEKPIIASRIPSSMEIASTAGCYFQLGSVEEFYHSVREALDDSMLLNRKNIMKQQVEKYDWCNLSHQYVGMYKKAIEL